jgi:hypothetical protein
MKNTHLCRCQAGFIAHARDLFSMPAANLHGWRLRDEVTFQEWEPIQSAAALPLCLRPASNKIEMTPTGKEATYEILKVSPYAPDGSRVETLMLERVR